MKQTNTRITSSCSYCQIKKLKCSNRRPCFQCIKRKVECVPKINKKRGPKSKSEENKEKLSINFLLNH
jgi:hypothetical protein